MITHTHPLSAAQNWAGNQQSLAPLWLQVYQQPDNRMVIEAFSLALDLELRSRVPDGSLAEPLHGRESEVRQDAHLLLLGRLPRHLGKIERELARIREGRVRPPYKIYVITWSEIEKCNHSRLFADFCLKTPRKELREDNYQVTFALAGFDENDAELYEQQVVRDYFRELHLHWPIWQVFARPDSSMARLIAACVAKNLRSVRKETRVYNSVWVSRADVSEFFYNALPLSAAFHHRAGLSPAQGYRQLKRIARHLGVE